MLPPVLLAILLLALAAAEPPPQGNPVDRIAEGYVKAALALGRHDPDYVDSWYGPKAWTDQVEAEKPGLRDIDARVAQLTAELKGLRAPADDADRLRRKWLRINLSSMAARLRMLEGSRMGFDEESRALYDAVAPPLADSVLDPVLEKLDARLPGTGPLADRYDAWRKDFVIPPDKVDTVFRTAVAEGRRRTLARVKLPANESFKIEYVTGKSWSGYNWYQGGYRSLIQVNVDLPIHIDRALDLACHEGYPGHHVFNVLIEQRLVNERGWKELMLYPLFSPLSLLAEGTAVYATDLTFSKEERLAFERDVLFPLAGLDPKRAEEYATVRDLIDQLKGTRVEGARRYLDGILDRESAIEWAMRHELRNRDQAERGVRFAEQYRSYVVNYSLGEQKVRRHVESAPDRDARWASFLALIASPPLPSELR